MPMTDMSYNSLPWMCTLNLKKHTKTTTKIQQPNTNQPTTNNSKKTKNRKSSLIFLFCFFKYQKRVSTLNIWLLHCGNVWCQITVTKNMLSVALIEKYYKHYNSTFLFAGGDNSSHLQFRGGTSRLTSIWHQSLLSGWRTGNVPSVFCSW